MVNVEKFAERLNIIMNYYEITAGNFADKIEVQRSSISHILSGRNKPSLDFVMKVLKEFPEVELYWLLNGTGSFPKQAEIKTPTPPIQINRTSTPATSENFVKNTEGTPNHAMPVMHEIKNSSAKEIEHIVIFYTDGTFSNYHSS